MPFEITLPQPTLSFKKAPHTYLSDIMPLSTYELEKDTRLDVSSIPVYHNDALISNNAPPPIPKESKSYTFKQLFTSLGFFSNHVSPQEPTLVEKQPLQTEEEDQPMGDDPLHIVLNTNLVEPQPRYSPLKSTYIMSLEKLRRYRERPIVEILLIHQTMSKMQSSVLVDNLHPSLIERRVMERAAFLRRVGKATCPQVVPAPLPVTSKQQYVPPPPPYFCFEKERDTSQDLEQSNDDDDDDDVPLGLLQHHLQKNENIH
ncbi:hypothetical protein K7432_003517 [Basidiobolus ranarum]|uniref:Uncharacterized protein n=1 Tax=Basidiobolus ranarum TaxID=34480 RepID=A0ABR2W647_9FUNG